MSKNNQTKITFLPVDNGDCIVINLNGFTILIDGGFSNKYKVLKKYLISNRIKTINLLVLTHSDRDHIGGIISLIRSSDFEVERIWFNSYDKMSQLFNNGFKDSTKDLSIESIDNEISFTKAKTLSQLLEDQGKIYEAIFNEKFENNSHSIGDIHFTFLSPNKKVLLNLYKSWSVEEKKTISTEISSTVKEIKTINEYANDIVNCKSDISLQNASSIAFILNYKDRNFLFLGDAHIEVIVESLKALNYTKENKLYVDFVKLSHHGSSANINQEFLDIVETREYIVSTNGKSHNHPDMETLCLLVVDAKSKDKKIKFCFNYPEDTYKAEKDILKKEENIVTYNYMLQFAEDIKKGYTIEL